MCEQAYCTRAEVRHRVLEFEDIIDEVLNGTGHIIILDSNTVSGIDLRTRNCPIFPNCLR